MIPKTSDSKLWEEYCAQTEPHPFNHTLRIWRNKVCFEIYSHPDTVHLAAIISIFPGMGDGSKALDWLVDLAKRHDCSVNGHISRIGKRGLTVSQLKTWYKRHGAKFSKNGYFIIYS